MIYSTTFNDFQGDMWSLSSPFGGQAVWAVASLFTVLLLSTISWQFWDTISAVLFGFGLLLLVLVLILGTEINGATSWFIIGPFSLQPGEFAKVSTAIAVSSLLSSVQIDLKELKSQGYVLGAMLLPAVLIFMQPDAGSALTYFSLIIVYYRFGMSVIYYLGLISLFFVIVITLTSGFYFSVSAILLIAVLLTSQFKRKNYRYGLAFITVLLVNTLLYRYSLMHYAAIFNLVFFIIHLAFIYTSKVYNEKFIVLASVIALSFFSFASSYGFNNILQPHQQDRINVWLNPEKSDPRGSYYNLAHSKLAIGSGGLYGKGYLKGSMTKLNYVPMQNTDFVFSSIGEELGFIGSGSIILIFLYFILRIIKIGEQSKINYIRAFCYCVGGFFFVHFFVNVGMTMGISPVIGIPLPFISKGGSSLLAFSMMVGIVLNMSKQGK